MNLLRTLRESAEPIKGICYSRKSDEYITYDDSALRVWNSTRQIRALHHSPKSNETFVAMFPAEFFDAALMIMEVGSKEQRSVVLRLVSFEMKVLQELEMPLQSTIKAALSDDCQTLILLDKSRQAVVFFLEVLRSSAEAPEESIAEKFNFVFTQKPPLPKFQPAPKPAELLKAHHIATFDCKEWDVRDFLVATPNCIAALTPSAILFLTRASLRRPPKKKKSSISDWKTQKEGGKASLLDDDEPSPKRPRAKGRQRESSSERHERGKSSLGDDFGTTTESVGAEETKEGSEEPQSPFHEFHLTSILQFRWEDFSGTALAGPTPSAGVSDPLCAVLFKLFPDRTFCIAFSDGSLRVVQFHARHAMHPEPLPVSSSEEAPRRRPAAFPEEGSTEDGDEAGLPSLLLCDIATPPMSSYKSASSSSLCIVNLFPCRVAPTFGPNAYVFEFFAISADLRLRLYGLRHTDRRYIPQVKLSATPLASASAVSAASSPVPGEAGLGEPSADSAASRLAPQSFELVDVSRGAGYLAAIDLIAEHPFREVPSKLAVPKLSSARLAPRVQVLACEPVGADNEPIARRVVVTFEGTVNLFDLCQPLRTLVSCVDHRGQRIARETATAAQMQRYISASARGPDLYSYDYALRLGEPRGPAAAAGGAGGGGDDDNACEVDADTVPSLLLLRGGAVDLVSAATGHTLQSLSLAHVLSASKAAGAGAGAAGAASPQRFQGSISRDHAVAAKEVDLEGEPSAVHWCPYTQLVVVGYSSGSCAVLSFQRPVLPEVHPDFTYIRSHEVHSSRITLAKTFPFRRFQHLVDDPLHPEPGIDLVVLLLGDDQGVVSLWQLDPLRRSGKSPLLFSVRQHTGAILHACLCSVPRGLVREPVATDVYTHFNTSDSAAKDTNHKILVTVCSRGLTVAWRVEKTLALDMLAFFNSRRAPARTTSCLVFPKMVYRKLLVPKPPAYQPDAASAAAATSAATSAATPTASGQPSATKRGEEVMPVANLYYELYCVQGYSDGALEVWNLSSDARYCTDEPIFALHSKDCALSCLLSCKTDDTTRSNQLRSAGHLFLPNSMQQEFTLANHPQDFLWADPDQSPYPNSATESFLCGYSDGTVVVLEMKINPLFSLDDDAAGGHVAAEPRLTLRRQNFLRLPCRLHSLLPASCHALQLRTLPRNKYAGPDPGISVWDFFFVSDFEVHLCLPFLSVSKALPRAWQRPAALLLAAAAPRDDDMLRAEDGNAQIDVLEEYSHRSMLSSLAEGSPPHPFQPLLPPDALSVAGSEASGANDSLSASLTVEASSVLSSATSRTSLSHRHDKKKYIGPMESMQRIVSSDLYIAKKDKTLLALFTQNANGPDATMTADQVVDIVQRWCNGLLGAGNAAHAIRKENLVELFHLLEIQSSDPLKFVEVAKIAAITLSAVKQGMALQQERHNDPQQQSQIAWAGKAAGEPRRTYKSLRTTKAKVVFNSMGEKVVQKVALSEAAMGVAGGTLAAVQSGLQTFLDTHRSAIQTLKAHPYKPPSTARLLRELPRPLAQALAPCSIVLGTDPWSPAGLHYFDEARTIAIGRTLLDMRSSSQYEAVQGKEIFRAGVDHVQSLPQLLVRHFERLYGESYARGEGSMDVSRRKVANYLEACLQYAFRPLLSVLKVGLKLDSVLNGYAGAEVALWLVTEARALLLSRGFVRLGEPILGAELALSESAVVGAGAKKKDALHRPQWQFVPRSAALSVCDELLRVRGRLGLQFYLPILDSVRDLAALDDGTEGATAELVAEARTHDLVDAERFLELLFYEFVRRDEAVRALQHRVFGNYALNVATPARSREINLGGSDRRPPISDELEPGFGPHHSSNMARIQDLMRVCMRHDPLRTGQLPPSALQAAFQKVLYDTMRADLRGREGDAYRLVLLAKAQTKVRSVEDLLSYIDMVAILLAWEESFQGFRVLCSAELLESLPAVGRSIEASLAKDLVKYFSMATSLDDVYNPRWVMDDGPGAASQAVEGEPDPRASRLITSAATGTDVDRKLCLPMDGQWRLHTGLPADGPGLLTVQSVGSLAPATDDRLGAVGGPTALERHRRETERLLQAAPKVAETTREVSTLAGEVARSRALDGGGVPAAPISVQRLDQQVALPRGVFTPGFEVVDERRRSYSRVMRRIASLKEESGLDAEPSDATRSGPKSTAKMLEEDLRDSLHLDPLPEPTVHALTSPGKRPSYFEESLARLDSQFSDTDSSHALLEGSVDSNYQHLDLAFLGEEMASLRLPVVGTTQPESPSQTGAASRSHASLTPFLDLRDADREVQRQDLARGGQFLEGNSLLLAALPDGLELSHPQRSQLLAEAEVTRRIHGLQEMEERFQEEYTEEKEAFERRKREKDLLREQLRREMQRKERESMKVYHKAMQERTERRERIHKQLDAIEAAEAADRKKRDLEIQRILDQNRSRALSKLHQKVSEEELALLRAQEERELLAMRKEEKNSLRVEQAWRDEQRRQQEALRAAEEAALAQRIAELAAMAQQAEAEAAARQSPGLEAEARFRHPTAALSRPASPAEEDDFVANLPPLQPAEPRPTEPRRQSSLLHLMRQETDLLVDVHRASASVSTRTDGDSDEEGDDDDDDEDEEIRGLGGADPFALRDDRALFAYDEQDETEGHRPATALEKRIQLLLRNIRQAYDDHRSHPRKTNGQFSLPLLFSEDVRFNPFESFTPALLAWHLQHEEQQAAGRALLDSHDEAEEKDGGQASAAKEGRTGTKGGGESNNNDDDDDDDDAGAHAYAKNPFADIDQAVKRYKRRQEEERMVMFKTQVAEVKAEDWTHVVRLSAVDWKHFFEKQQTKLDLIKAMARGPDSVAPEPEPSIEEGTGAVAAPASSRSHTFSLLRASVAIPANVMGIPKSLVQVLPEDTQHAITPLPFGKVLRRQQVAPDQLRFFQVEVVEEDCLVTLELRSVRGLADLYISKHRLPSTVKYQQKASCSRENNLLARLTLEPDGTGSYFVAVATSTAGAEFDLWAYATSGSVGRGEDSNPRIQQVTRIIDKWNLLAEHSMDELQVHYPRLEAEAAHRSADLAAQRLKAQKKRRAVLREMQLLAQAGRLDTVLSKPFSQASTLSTKTSGMAVDADDVENLESFVVKVGRFAMRKDRELAADKDLASPADGDEAPRLASPQSTRGAAPSPPATRAASRPTTAAARKLDADGLFAREDPNQHADLFTAPVIHRNRSIALITPLQKLLAQEEGDDAAELRQLLEEEASAEAERQRKYHAQAAAEASSLHFGNVTALLASNTANLKAQRDAGSLAGQSSNSSCSSDDSDQASPLLQSLASSSRPMDLDLLLPPSLSKTASQILPLNIPQARGARKASRGPRVSGASIAAALGGGTSQSRSASLLLSSTHLPSSPHVRPTTLAHNHSQPALRTDRESRLAAEMDRKGKVRQNKVATLSHLVFLDPKPVAYKMSL